MSNIIPMVSSSPPPMDAGDGFDWDDDDDGFGTFTGADDSGAFPQVKQFPTDGSGNEDMNDSKGQTNFNQSSSIGQSDENDQENSFANFATFPNDTKSVNPNDTIVSTTEADARPNCINLPNETNDLDKNNSENSKSEKCLTCDTNGILTDSGMYSSDVSPVPQTEDVDSVDDITADVEHLDANKSDASKSTLESKEVLNNVENDPVSNSVDKTNGISEGFDAGKESETSDSNSCNSKETDSSVKTGNHNEINEDSISTTDTKISTNMTETLDEPESSIEVSVCQNDSQREECTSHAPCDNVDSQTNIPSQETPSHSPCNTIDNTTVDEDIAGSGSAIDEGSEQHIDSDHETDAQGDAKNETNVNDNMKDSECEDDWDAFATVGSETTNEPSTEACLVEDHISPNETNCLEPNNEHHTVQQDGESDSLEVETEASDSIPPDQGTAADSSVDFGDTDGDSECTKPDDLPSDHEVTGGTCAISVDDNDEIIKDNSKLNDQSLTVSNDDSGKDEQIDADCDSHLKNSDDNHMCSKDEKEQVCESPEDVDVDNSGSDDNDKVESDNFGDLTNEDDGFADFNEFKATEQGNIDDADTAMGSFAAFGNEDKQEETDDWAGFPDPTSSNQIGTTDSWAAFSEPQIASASQDLTEDGDEWADFEDESTEFGAGDTPSQPDTKPAAEKPLPPALQNMSKQEKVMYAVTTCFPEVLSDLEAEVSDIDSLVSVTEATHREASIWLQIRGLQTTNALSYQWSRSHWNNQLFSTLHVDTRNVLVGHKKAQVPIFASGLTLLEPVKGQGAPMKPDMLVDTSKVDTLPTTQPQEAIPPAQFDWQGSGLTNPLEANKTLTLDFLIQDQATKSNALESEFLTTESPVHKPTIQPLESILANLKGTPTFKPTNQHEDVSTAALKVVDKLPNLSFMKSKVLMFPIKMDQ